MIQNILHSNNAYSGTLLRIGLGLVILPHGIQKITNFDSILNILESYYHLPTFIGIMVVFIEFFCSIFLILGVFSRISALLLGLVLLGAGFYHIEHGFFINWLGKQAGEGYQFSLLYVFAAATSVLLGGGKWSIDNLLLKKIKK